MHVGNVPVVVRFRLPDIEGPFGCRSLQPRGPEALGCPGLLRGRRSGFEAPVSGRSARRSCRRNPSRGPAECPREAPGCSEAAKLDVLTRRELGTGSRASPTGTARLQGAHARRFWRTTGAAGQPGSEALACQTTKINCENALPRSRPLQTPAMPFVSRRQQHVRPFTPRHTSSLSSQMRATAYSCRAYVGANRTTAVASAATFFWLAGANLCHLQRISTAARQEVMRQGDEATSHEGSRAACRNLAGLPCWACPGPACPGRAGAHPELTPSPAQACPEPDGAVLSSGGAPERAGPAGRMMSRGRTWLDLGRTCHEQDI